MSTDAGNGSRAESIADVRERILLELNRIIDPCSIATALPAGLVDMGLVREVDVDPRDNGAVYVKVKLCVTHGLCMMSALFLHEAEESLRRMPVVAAFDVILDAATIWTEELMSAEYKRRLQAQRLSRRLE